MTSLEGQYTNYFEVGHNAFEFLIDFGQMYYDGPEGKSESRMHTRIITSPVFAKRLAEVLNRALAEYEQTHGRVPGEADEPDSHSKTNVRHIRGFKPP